MLEILLDPNGAPLNPRLPAHDAIRNILRRCLRYVEPCGCAAPWLRVYVAERWREGQLAVSGIQACCTERERAALHEIPTWMVTLEKVYNAFSPPPRRGPRPTMRLLLDDVRGQDGQTIAEGIVVAPVCSSEEDPLPIWERYGSLAVRSEEACVVDRLCLRSFLVRPLYHKPDLVKAIEEFKPIEVVGYWRRFGFVWSPRSIFAAERFGVGVGGSFTARLTRLFPDAVPDEIVRGVTSRSIECV